MRNPQFQTYIPTEIEEKIEDWCGPNYKIANVWYHDETHMVTVHYGKAILSLRLFKIGDKIEISQDNTYKMGDNFEPKDKE